MRKFLDIVIPRWITEKVAVMGNEKDGYEVVCCEKDLEPNEYYDFLATARSFNFFGISLFAHIEIPDSHKDNV